MSLREISSLRHSPLRLLLIGVREKDDLLIMRKLDPERAFDPIEVLVLVHVFTTPRTLPGILDVNHGYSFAKVNGGRRSSCDVVICDESGANNSESTTPPRLRQPSHTFSRNTQHQSQYKTYRAIASVLRQRSFEPRALMP